MWWEDFSLGCRSGTLLEGVGREADWSLCVYVDV